MYACNCIITVIFDLKLNVFNFEVEVQCFDVTIVISVQSNNGKYFECENWIYHSNKHSNRVLTILILTCLTL